MASVLEEIRKIVASLSADVQKEPGEGSRPVFDKAAYVQKMKASKQYRGAAGNLLWLKLDEWAIPNQKLSRQVLGCNGLRWGVGIVFQARAVSKFFRIG